MREILFRGQRTDTKEWVIKAIIFRPDGQFVIIQSGNEQKEVNVAGVEAY